MPCGAESSSSLLNEEHLLARLPVGGEKVFSAPLSTLLYGMDMKTFIFGEVSSMFVFLWEWHPHELYHVLICPEPTIGNGYPHY